MSFKMSKAFYTLALFCVLGWMSPSPGVEAYTSMAVGFAWADTDRVDNGIINGEQGKIKQLFKYVVGLVDPDMAKEFNKFGFNGKSRVGFAKSNNGKAYGRSRRQLELEEKLYGSDQNQSRRNLCGYEEKLACQQWPQTCADCPCCGRRRRLRNKVLTERELSDVIAAATAECESKRLESLDCSKPYIVADGQELGVSASEIEDKEQEISDERGDEIESEAAEAADLGQGMP